MLLFFAIIGIVGALIKLVVYKISGCPGCGSHDYKLRSDNECTYKKCLNCGGCYDRIFNRYE